MKTFQLFGTKYELSPTSSEPPEAYGFRNSIVDDQPKGKRVGYVTMEDGSVIECYTKFNPLIIIIPILVIVLCAGAVGAYLWFGQPKDVVGPDGEPLKEGEDNNVVMYNGFTSIKDGQLNIDFTNGSQQATIHIEGDGISVEDVVVEPDQYIASVPATFTSEEGIVQATMTVSTDTSSNELELVVEIPENNLPDSYPEGMDSYWKGEFIYGE